MKMYEIMKRVNNIHKGSFATINYQTSLDSKMKASEKRNGTKVTKVVTKTVRFGCDYDKMKATIEARENGRGTRDCYEAPIIEDVLYENKKNGQVYLRVGTVANDNVKTKYFVNGQEVKKEALTDIMTPSFFNNTGVKPEVQNIKIENIISIG